MRTYRTGLVGDAAAGGGMFGAGWRADFEYHVGALGDGTSSGVMLFDAAGRKIFYRRDYAKASEIYNSPDGNGGSITKNADGSYLWQDAQGTSYQFDATGNILSITDIHGNQETIGYSGGRITSLTDRHGRVVTFDYQGTNHVRRLLGPSITANPTGVYATYAYDAKGNLADVSYPDGNTLIYRYENASWPNFMTRHSASGPHGPNFQQLFQYDPQGRVQAVSEGPEGRSFRLAYGLEYVDFDPAHPEFGKKTLYHTTVTEWTDANWDFQINGGESQKAQHTYYFENRGGADVVTKIEDGGCSCAAEKVYDAAFHVTQSRDNKGVTSRMTYDGYGKLTSLTEAAGTEDERVTGFEYVYPATPVFPGQILQKTIRKKSVSPADDKLTTEINDPATGRLQARREQGFHVDGSPLAAETGYVYTASGAVQTIDGPRQGSLDQVTYDYYPAGGPAAGMLWKINEPNGAVTTIQEYDGLGNVLRKTDANNRDTTYGYDSRGFLQVLGTVDGTTRYAYDAQGNIAKTTYPMGNSVVLSHGQAGVTRVSDAAGRIDYGYANGNRVSERVYDAASILHKSTAYEYDDRNRLWRAHQASGDFEEFLYDENGNLAYKKLYAAAAPTVPFKTTVRGYDSLNRLTSVSVAGDPYHVSFDYNVAGDLSTVTDPVDQTTQYLYDDLGRQGRVISPETGTTEYAHDEAGNVISSRDNLNRLITYAYDGLNRLTDISYPDATAPVHYRYDDYSSGNSPDARGRPTEVTDASGFRRFFYDAAGRLSKVVHLVDERDFTTEYVYDLNGNLASLTYPDGRTIHYLYDPLSGRVQSVTSWKNGVTTVLAAGITHKPFGPLSDLDYGNGTHLAKGHENLMYRLNSLAVTGPLGDLLPARNYDYDPAGNIHVITRDLPVGAEPHAFGYDPMNRLTDWTKPGHSQELTYDANGNRQSLADGGQVTSYSYDPVARNILASSTGTENQVYNTDVIGNTSGWGTKSLIYDVNNRLGWVEDGGVPVSEYVYNIDGQRTKKIVAGQITYYEYDVSGRLMYEHRADEGVAVDYVYLEGEPLAMLVSDNVVESFTVTPSAGPNGSLSPSTPQAVNYNLTTAFTVAPNFGYHIGTVDGCGGTLNGSTYTTGPITADCTVSASFVINSYSLATTKSGNGGGTVNSSPAGISCGAACSATYDHGTVVNLSQTANAGSFFTGWGGGCSGTGACAITMSAANAVTATFSSGITVSVPNGGETWKKNTTYTIRWSYLGNPGTSVKIDLLKGGALNRTIKTSTSVGSGGSGSYSWKVPNNQAAGSDYRIRVTSTKSGSYTGTSNANFTIY